MTHARPEIQQRLPSCCLQILAKAAPWFILGIMLFLSVLLGFPGYVTAAFCPPEEGGGRFCPVAQTLLSVLFACGCPTLDF